MQTAILVVRSLLIALAASFVMNHSAHADSHKLLSSVVDENFRAEIRLNNGVVIYDLVYAGPESVSGEVARRFLVEMEAFSDLAAYTEVDLAYHGEIRYRIYVGDLMKLTDGFTTGGMASFNKLMRLPGIMQSLKGKYAFPRYEGSSLQQLRYMSEDFNRMLDHWFLGALLTELRAAQP